MFKYFFISILYIFMGSLAFSENLPVDSLKLIWEHDTVKYDSCLCKDQDHAGI